MDHRKRICNLTQNAQIYGSIQKTITTKIQPVVCIMFFCFNIQNTTLVLFLFKKDDIVS